MGGTQHVLPYFSSIIVPICNQTCIFRATFPRSEANCPVLCPALFVSSLAYPRYGLAVRLRVMGPGALSPEGGGSSLAPRVVCVTNHGPVLERGALVPAYYCLGSRTEAKISD
jgi:hypothetical protein